MTETIGSPVAGKGKRLEEQMCIRDRPDAALRMALDFEGKPFVITDSGDNTTSGATGWNTFLLRQVLSLSLIHI